MMRKKKIMAAVLAAGLALCTSVQVLAEETPVLETQEAIEDTEMQEIKDDMVSDFQTEEETDVVEQNSDIEDSVSVLTLDEDAENILDYTAKDMETTVWQKHKIKERNGELYEK